MSRSSSCSKFTYIFTTSIECGVDFHGSSIGLSGFRINLSQKRKGAYKIKGSGSSIGKISGTSLGKIHFNNHHEIIGKQFRIQAKIHHGFLRIDFFQIDIDIPRYPLGQLINSDIDHNHKHIKSPIEVTTPESNYDEARDGSVSCETTPNTPPSDLSVSKIEKAYSHSIGHNPEIAIAVFQGLAPPDFQNMNQCFIGICSFSDTNE